MEKYKKERGKIWIIKKRKVGKYEKGSIKRKKEKFKQQKNKKKYKNCNNKKKLRN